MMNLFDYRSNYYPVCFKYKGYIVNSAETAFQMMKTLNSDERMMVSYLNAPSALKAGRQLELRSDWDEVKVAIMYTILYEKFDQTIGIQELLLKEANECLRGVCPATVKFWGNRGSDGLCISDKLLRLVKNELSEYSSIVYCWCTDYVNSIENFSRLVTSSEFELEVAKALALAGFTEVEARQFFGVSVSLNSNLAVG